MPDEGTVHAQLVPPDQPVGDEAVLEAAQHRLDQMPDAMKVWRRTVEHVFGMF